MDDIRFDDVMRRRGGALPRRSLLAGGLALAASGLLLPADAAASDRRKRRRRRRKRRNPGRGLLRNFAFEVKNLSTWREVILGVGDGFGNLHSETFKANTSRRMVIDNDVAFLFFTEGPLENGSYRGRLLELNKPDVP